MGSTSYSKPPPEDVAQVCLNGHVIVSSLQWFPQLSKNYCEECGARAIDRCQSCGWPIAGPSPNSWMVEIGRPYQPPKYCGECGHAFPWTEIALKAAREYADDIEELTPAEKVALKETFEDLTKDTARTPVAASRFKRIVSKISPAAANLLQKVVETVITEAAKKAIGL